MSTVTYLEAIVIGALQGVSELFPVSSLGHSVLLPALVGGRWAADLDVTARHSPYLAVLVAMHVATAVGMLIYFRHDWARVARGLFTSLRTRRIDRPDQRLAWLLVLATIPVGIVGLALANLVQTVLGKPIPSAIFLALNGLVLFVVERTQRGRTEPASATTTTDSADTPGPSEQTLDFAAQPTMVLAIADPAVAADRKLARLSARDALMIGASQSLALLPGISRSGITIVTGLYRGLRHDLAARFAFLLSTPVILAAGALKIPELFEPANRPVLGPALVGSLLAGVAAYFSTRFLTTYFETRTLKPFAIYCAIVGLGSLAVFLIR
ncbi:MAG TPA: undecaprenyl-diphosphate phosphatase [Pseudonocardia sp.]|nr:undecaprenyl-diphosphate phosphatase [Pseudonocardia sp.]